MADNPVARRAAMLLASTTGSPEELAAALGAAGLLAAPAVQVPGPYPVYIRTTGLGASIDVHPLVAALMRALAAESVEDPEGVADDLAAIDGASGGGQDALMYELLDRLGGTEMRYGSTGAHELADRIRDMAGPRFPQQERRAG